MRACKQVDSFKSCTYLIGAKVDARKCGATGTDLTGHGWAGRPGTEVEYGKLELR